jgi:hypothetical protein
MGGMNAMPGAYPGSSQSIGHGLGYSLNNILGSVGGFGMNQAGSPEGSSGDELDNLLQPPGMLMCWRYRRLLIKLNGPMNGAMANQLDYIMNDPRKTNQEIKDLLENIRPDVDLPPEDREGTPEGLVYPLVSSPVTIHCYAADANSCIVRTSEVGFDVAKVHGRRDK